MARAQYGLEVDGLDECLRAFKQLDKELRKNANGELRQASKKIATDMIPHLGGSGAPQEAAILAAAGPKSDRYVVIAVPSKKPKLSGARRTPAAQAKRIGFALERGSDYPPFRGPASGRMIAANLPAIAKRAVPVYERTVVTIMRRYGLI